MIPRLHIGIFCAVTLIFILLSSEFALANSNPLRKQKSSNGRSTTGKKQHSNPSQVLNNYNVNEKVIKNKTNKVNNISLKEKNKFNSQMAQVVVNVPKQNLVLRVNRYPTKEEFEMKARILQIFKEIRGYLTPEGASKFNHLKAILEGLNPKYIATQRLFKIIYSDPDRPYVPPEPLPGPTDGGQSVDGAIVLQAPEGEALADNSQLDRLLDRIGHEASWDMKFISWLANEPDSKFSPRQLSLKKLLLCLSNENLCPKSDVQQAAKRKLEEKGVYGMMSGDAIEAFEPEDVKPPPEPQSGDEDSEDESDGEEEEDDEEEEEEEEEDDSNSASGSESASTPIAPKVENKPAPVPNLTSQNAGSPTAATEPKRAPNWVEFRAKQKLRANLARGRKRS